MWLQQASTMHLRPQKAGHKNTQVLVPCRRRVHLLSILAVVTLAIVIVIMGRIYRFPRAQPFTLQTGGAVSTSHSANQSSAGSQAVVAGTAAGTCLAFAPSRGNLHHTVYIDPGHGGIDPGTTGTTSAGVRVDEVRLSLATGLQLMTLLRRDGYRVVMSRIDNRVLLRPTADDLQEGALTPTGVRHDIEARIDCANAAHADILVAIHFNAYDDPTVDGAETLYDPDRSFSAASLRLATFVQHAIVEQLRAAGRAAPDRGVKDDTTVGTPALTAKGVAYGHLLELGPISPGWLDHPSTMPGIVSEPVFLTHSTGADIAASTHGQQVMAQGMAQGINAYFAATSHS